MQAPQNLTFEAGSPFSGILGQMPLLVVHVRCVEHVAPDEGTIQLAIKTVMIIDDQHASLVEPNFSRTQFCQLYLSIVWTS